MSIPTAEQINTLNESLGRQVENLHRNALKTRNVDLAREMCKALGRKAVLERQLGAVPTTERLIVSYTKDMVRMNVMTIIGIGTALADGAEHSEKWLKGNLQ